MTESELVPVEEPTTAPATVDVSEELTRESILAKQDVVTDRVDVPEWGGHLFVKAMTGKERDLFEESLIVGRGKNREVNLRNMRAKLISRTAVNSRGEKLFTPTDVEVLGDKSAAALQRVFSKAQDLAGLGDDDVDELTAELGEEESAGSGST